MVEIICITKTLSEADLIFREVLDLLGDNVSKFKIDIRHDTLRSTNLFFCCKSAQLPLLHGRIKYNTIVCDLSGSFDVEVLYEPSQKVANKKEMLNLIAEIGGNHYV